MRVQVRATSDDVREVRSERGWAEVAKAFTARSGLRMTETQAKKIHARAIKKLAQRLGVT